ncbi:MULTISPECIES: hypothetical protein [Clostridiaceae]|uniref:Uncharacterized protein n=1 Tax=Clostridium facile TaxID=2763035 RepID=A0ABR7IPM5_9CLOT|nr:MULTISPECIES: hypothetical protein [Clostridiaceae]MBC5787067.1 hypothetical protein [Clostridium facile]
MLKAIRDFLIYDAFVALIMMIVYILPSNSGWMYFWGFIIYYPTIYLGQFVFGLLLGYRAIKKYNISCLKFLILSLLFFLITWFTLCIPSLSSILLYEYMNVFPYIKANVLYACIFIVFYLLSYFITKFYIKFYF